MSDAPPILISAPPGTAAADVRAVVQAAGFAAVDHALGSLPAVDFQPLAAAVVLPADNPESAVAQTKRWRIELGDRYRPILWLADPAAAVVGLDAGADVCLPRPPDDAIFAAQLRALLRVRDGVARLLATAHDATAVVGRLRKAYDVRDADRELGRTLHRSLTPARLPAGGPYRLTLRSRGADDFCDAWPAGDELELVLAGAGGPVGPVVKQLVSAACVRGPAGAASPGDMLRQVNRGLMAIGLPDPPLVSAAVVRAEPSGRVAFARAGLPPPLCVPAAGDPRPWPTPGPFLGVAEAEFPTFVGELRPGDKLQFVTAGEAGTVVVLERVG